MRFSTNINLFMLVVFLLAACYRQPSQAHLQDIATNLNGTDTPSGVYLYYREDQNVTRTRCPDGLLAVNYNRQNCTEQKQSVPMKPFIETISTGVGATIDQRAKNVQDLYAGIANVDNKLIEYLIASPAVKDQALEIKNELISLEADVAAKQLLLSDVDKQISAIKETMKNTDHVELNAQLATLTTRRSQLLTEQNQIKASEKSKRDQFITANSSVFDQSTYQDIQAQKEFYNQQLTSEQAAFDAALQEVSDLNKAITHLNDATFTFNVLQGLPAFTAQQPFVKRFQAAFDSLYSSLNAPVSSFTPTEFAPNSVATITFTALLPWWVTTILIDVDGVVSTVPAASKINLPVDTTKAGKHSVRITFANDAWGVKSPQSAETAIAVRDAVRLVASFDSTCAIAGSKIDCWGQNIVNFAALVPAESLKNGKQFAMGDKHLCILADGKVGCWGDNTFGQTIVPTGLQNVTQLTVGRFITCALSEGRVQCWGDNRFDEVKVPHDLKDVTQISGGDHHTCAVSAGKLKCWGFYAELDNMSSRYNSYHLYSPRWDRSCWTNGGDAHCPGFGIPGSEGFSDSDHWQKGIPSSLPSVDQVIAGRGGLSCIRSEEKMICWGRGGMSILGFYYDDPEIPASLSGVTQLVVGETHVCALASDKISC